MPNAVLMLGPRLSGVWALRGHGSVAKAGAFTTQAGAVSSEIGEDEHSLAGAEERMQSGSSPKAKKDTRHVNGVCSHERTPV